MFLHLYAQRVGMSVAIVCMVNQTAISKPDVNELNETKVIKADCERDSANGTVEVSLTKLFQIGVAGNCFWNDAQHCLSYSIHVCF